MISARKLYSTLTIIFLVAICSFTATVFGISLAKPIVFLTVFIGAILAIFGGMAAIFGKLDNDIFDEKINDNEDK